MKEWLGVLVWVITRHSGVEGVGDGSSRREVGHGKGEVDESGTNGCKETSLRGGVDSATIKSWKSRGSLLWGIVRGTFKSADINVWTIEGEKSQRRKIWCSYTDTTPFRRILVLTLTKGSDFT